MVRSNCIECGGVLKSIGLERANGKITIGKYNNDWDKRKYHKKCFKIVKERQMTMWKIKGLFPI